MEDLTEFAHSHKHGEDTGWWDTFPEHVWWFASRTLLILAAVLIAFMLKIPFEKLMQRDVLTEIEGKEKAKLIDEYELLDKVVITAKRFQATFDDSVRLTLSFSRNSTDETRRMAREKIDLAKSQLRRLDSLFGERNLPLSRAVELDLAGILSEGNRAVNLEEELLSRHGANPEYSFEAHTGLIAKYVVDLQTDREAALSLSQRAREHRPWW